MVKVEIKGVEKDLEMVGSTCYEIPKKDGKTVVVARVKAGSGKKGGTLIRFAKVVDTSACKDYKTITRKGVGKLVIGKREFPKILRLATGATPKAPAFIPGKMLAALAKKQEKRQKQKQKQS
jgi:hypothetical protein